MKLQDFSDKAQVSVFSDFLQEKQDPQGKVIAACLKIEEVKQYLTSLETIVNADEEQLKDELGISNINTRYGYFTELEIVISSLDDWNRFQKALQHSRCRLEVLTIWINFSENEILDLFLDEIKEINLKKLKIYLYEPDNFTHLVNDPAMCSLKELSVIGLTTHGQIYSRVFSSNVGSVLTESPYLSKLESLFLYNGNFSDEEVLKLKGLTQLKHLNLGYSASKEAVAKLQSYLPECEITGGKWYDK